MGPRIALSGVVDAGVFDKVIDYVGFEFLLPFNTSKSGINQQLSTETQERIAEFSRRPVPTLDPVFTNRVYHPMMDQEALAEFGLWCREGCPVTVDGLVYRYRYGLAASSDARRVFTI